MSNGGIVRLLIAKLRKNRCKKNERVCKALNLKHRLMQGRSKLDTDVSKLRGKEKVRYKLPHGLARLFVSSDVKDWNSFLIVLLRNGTTTKENVGKSGRMNLYYCVGKQSFWSMKFDPFLTQENLERVFRERMERRLKESESVIKRAERHAVEEPKPEKKQLRSRECLPNRGTPFNRTSRLSYHRCRLSSYGMCPKVMRRPTVGERRFTHLHANRLTGIVPTIGYGMTSRPESRNAASTHPRAETFLRHSCNKWCHPARHLHLSLNHQTSECRMFR